MIFSGVSPDGRKHFDMVLDGSKTRTTRLSDRYKVGKDYAIQPKRTKKGIEGYRVVIDEKWYELPLKWKEMFEKGGTFYGDANRFYKQSILHHTKYYPISEEDAKVEGGYTPEEFEEVFKKLFPKWGGRERWAYVFHIMELSEYYTWKGGLKR